MALAERLDIHPRSLRRDIERLRALGYPVHAAPGSGGGDRLGQGAAALQLLFEEDEALTMAVALRAAAPAVRGMDAAAARVMAKLDPLLPRPGHAAAGLSAPFWGGHHPQGRAGTAGERWAALVSAGLGLRAPGLA